MSRRWRLLLSPPGRGPWNMAVDEAVLESVGRGEAPPTLRLYAWSPPCLSLGRSQPYEEVDEAALQRLGWEAVRRPTGGRAILHTDELTYALLLPPDEPLAQGSVLESYRRIAAGLVRALELLGAPVEVQQGGGSLRQAPPVCFETPSAYEITVGGRKLLGSAQARRREGVLQHGTLPLHGDLTRITRVLRFADEATRADAAERLLQKACTLETALGRRVSWQEAAAAWERAFAETFELDLRRGALTEAERARAQALVREKYAHPDWLRAVSARR